MRKKKYRLAAALLCTASVATAVVAFSERVITRVYTVATEKVSAPIRLALLTDLHCCAYGEEQRELLNAVEAQYPDLVLLGGDILDDDPALPEENAWTVIEALAQRYLTYYVTGNHEFWGGRAEGIKDQMAHYGVTVLSGERDTVLFHGQPLNLCGIDDPAVGEEQWEAQLNRLSGAGGDDFTLLLTHRPERVKAYQSLCFDLVLAGHAHGGQWRLPGLVNGLLAPNQGFFPAYAGGRYDLGKTTLIVSRGLARESTRVPRIFNRPELVIVDVVPGS